MDYPVYEINEKKKNGYYLLKFNRADRALNINK